MNFIKVFFANLMAIMVALILFTILSVVALIGLVATSSSKSDKAPIIRNSVLHINLDRPIVENEEPDPFDFNFGSFFPGAGSKRLGLYQVEQYLEKAQSDDKIEGIFLELNPSLSAGWASLSTIRKSLVAFKSSGKYIYAYSDIYSEKSYYLASVADSVFMAPTGIMELNGLSSSPVFFKSMFDKLDLKPVIFRVGTFKSAIEPFTRTNMSEASKRQTKRYLGDMWNIFAKEVAESRDIPLEDFNLLADKLIYPDGDIAHAHGLIDRIAYKGEVLDLLKTTMEVDTDKSLPTVSLSKYLKTEAPSKDYNDNQIAVIFAEGGIQSGKSADGVIGSETLTQAFRKARKNDKVKAVVLRINSPGGSALASDMIAEEVRLTAEVKPVIASMGDLAASGGYYIAAPCDKIYAHPNTLTGSIGIFSIFFNSKDFFSNKVGLTFDQVETHTSSNIGNPNFPISDAEKAFLQKNTEKGYETFLEVVRAGREFENRDAVDKIAQGRVWSGNDAKGLNLVDEWGGLQDAIEEAAMVAGLGEDYQLKLGPKIKSPFESMLEEMMEGSMSHNSFMKTWKSELEMLQQVKQYIPESGSYALMPLHTEIK